MNASGLRKEREGTGGNDVREKKGGQQGNQLTAVWHHRQHQPLIRGSRPMGSPPATIRKRQGCWKLGIKLKDCLSRLVFFGGRGRYNLRFFGFPLPFFNVIV